MVNGGCQNVTFLLRDPLLVSKKIKATDCVN